MFRRILGLVAMLPATMVSLLAQQPSNEPWVTISEIPPSEQLPAAPLLVTAYAIVWLVPMLYLWFIWSRLNKVEREVRDLERRAPGGTRA
jgi:CcmD family protein